MHTKVRQLQLHEPYVENNTTSWNSLQHCFVHKIHDIWIPKLPALSNLPFRCPWHRRHFRYPPHSPCDQTSHSGAAPPGDTSGAIRWFQKTWTWGDSRLITNVYMNYIICRYVYLYTSFLSMHVYNVYIYICTGSTERRILFFGGLSVWNRSWLLVAGQRTQNHAGAEAPSRRRQASSRWRFLWTFLLK